MSEHDQRSEEEVVEEQRIEDLDVPEEQSEDVVGGRKAGKDQQE